MLASCGATSRAPVAAPLPGPYSLVEVGVGRPDAVVDLGDDASAALVSARWRHAPVSLRDVEGVEPGPDARPVPSSARTLGLSLGPRHEGWNAAAWEPFEPRDLETRRGHGHLSMGWVRVELVLPERIGGVPVRGATVAFEMTADDYGEVWVDGRLPHRVGDRGGAVVAGWNAPNRVVLTTRAEPGMSFDVAALVVNGPISRSPANFYWVRQAWLDVYVPGGDASPPVSPLERRGPAVERIAPEGSVLEVVAAGFQDLGPIVWLPDEACFLLSDVRMDTLHRFDPATGALGLVQTHAGAVGAVSADLGDAPRGITALSRGVDGLVYAHRAGRLEVVRYERNGSITVLADPDRVVFQGLHWARDREILGTALGTAVHDVEPHGLEVSHPDRAAERWLATDVGVIVMQGSDVLARLLTEMPIRGLAFGDDDVLYLTAADRLLRLRRR